MPEGLGVVEFCCGIVDAVAEVAVAVKPQAAFFEAQGADGWAALTEVCGYAREAGLLVIADGKRGDVPSTARAYAAAFAPIADAVTVNPYLGRDSLEPFFAHDGLGVLAIVKTSNPGSADLQDLPLADGRPFWQHVAALVDRWGEDYVGESGLSSVGAVVGATHPDAARGGADPAAARRVAPARRRRAGRAARRSRRGLHRRRGERAPLRVAVRPLRRSRRGMAGGRSGRGRAARRRAARRRRRGLTGGAEQPHALGRAGRLPRRDHDRSARHPRRLPTSGSHHNSRPSTTTVTSTTKKKHGHHTSQRRAEDVHGRVRRHAVRRSRPRPGRPSPSS